MAIKHEAAVITDDGKIHYIGMASEPHDASDLYIRMDNGQSYIMTQVVLSKYARQYSEMLQKHHKDLSDLKNKQIAERSALLVNARIPLRRV